MIEYAHEDPVSRQWIEEFYNKSRGNMTKNCFLICDDEQAAKDCVQEAFLMLLLHAPFTDKDHVGKYANVVAKSAAYRFINKKSIAARHNDNVYDFLQNSQAPKDEGVFKYYPASSKLMEGLKQLRYDTKMALVSYLYSIPVDAMARALNINSMTLRHRGKKALKQLRGFVTGETGSITDVDNRTIMHRDPKTDLIYKLKKSGWKTREVASYVGLSGPTVSSRFYERVKLMKRHPESFKDLL